MAEKQGRGAIETTTDGRNSMPELPSNGVSNLAGLPKVQKRNLRKLSALRPANNLPSGMGEHRLSIEEETGSLEATRLFAKETNLNIADSRPCIARLFYEGVAAGGMGRKPSAFIIALELSVCGLPATDISRHLEAYNSRLVPPLTQNILANVLRAVGKNNNRFRYGCAKLQSWCVGADICPWKKGTAASLSLCRQSGPNAFVMLGWPGYIKGSTTSVYLALILLFFSPLSTTRFLA